MQKVWDVCEAQAYVVLTVYQGKYSAVTRAPEELLFPLMRKLDMAFCACSPIAGGLLTKSREQIEADGTRFSPDQMYGLGHKMYVNYV